MTTSNAKTEPWFRNPWVWLIIAIHSLTVIGCAFTIYLALTNPHILVGEQAPGTTQTTESIDTGRP